MMPATPSMRRQKSSIYPIFGNPVKKTQSDHKLPAQSVSRRLPQFFLSRALENIAKQHPLPETF